MSKTVRRFPFSGALSRAVVLSFLASGLFFWAPGTVGKAFAATNPPVGSVGHVDEFAAAPVVSEAASSPVGITTGPNSTLLYTDGTTNTSIGQMSVTGTIIGYTRTVSPNALPTGIAPGSDGTYFTESSGQDQVARFKPPSTIDEFNVTPPASTPLGITAGSNGAMWYTETIARKIGTIPTGQPGGLTVTGTAFPVAVVTQTLGNPIAIASAALTSGGDLFFTEQGNTSGAVGGHIGDMNPISGLIVTETAVPGTGVGLDGIAIAPNGTGNLWFTEQLAGLVGTMNPITHAINTNFPTLPTSARPTAITVGADGNVWFVDPANNAIGNINPTGTVTEYSGGISPNAFAPNAPPFGITVGPDGNVWFTEQTASGGQIGRLTTAAFAVAGSASVSPASLTYPSQTIGTTSTAQTVTFTATGGNGVTPTAVVASADFSVTTGGTCAVGTGIAPGSSCTITVAFAPGTAGGAGTRTGALSITSNASSGSPSVVTLSGTAAAAGSASVSPASLTYPSQTIGTTSTAQTVTFTATGGNGVTPTAVVASADFSVTTGGTCAVGTGIAPGSSCTITVAFAPGTAGGAGTRTGTLSITSNASSGSPSVVTLSGTAAAAGGGGGGGGVTTTTGTFSANPTSVAFGGSLLGQPSAAASVVFTNNTNAAVAVSTATVTGANPGDFQILTDGCSTKSIAIGAQCSISVEFLPGTAGNRTANLSVTDTAGTQTVALTGTGLAARQSGGYWLDATDGGIFSYGPAAKFFGSTGSIVLNKPIVGMAPTPDGLGYWLVASDGGIFNYGDARFFGSAGAIKLNKPIVGMAATPTGNGYWLVATDGGIFSYGDATFFGSTGGITLNKPIAGMATSPSGLGYWLVATDGGIFNYGDARFFGSAGAIKLNKPIVGMAATASGNGYWLDATDGGIFTYGDATFHGSAGSINLNKPMVGMAPSPSGNGYWLVASDGGIFNYGDAKFFGSAGSINLNKPIVGMAAANF